MSAAPATSLPKFFGLFDSPAATWQELKRRQPALAWFGLLLLLGIAPALIALSFDERMLRGVNVWVKPIKFMASIAMFSWWSAWFIGMLTPERQHATAIRRTVWLIICTGGFEMAYILLQAALGQASHYNQTDLLHIVMYGLMGAGALALTASQGVIAWQVHRHALPSLPALMRTAVVLACSLTFFLGAGAGGALGGLQPPDGIGVPVVGWHLAGGDMRPAHFIGMHAQQVMPLAAWLLLRLRTSSGKLALYLITLAWVILWALAFGNGLPVQSTPS